MASKLHQLRNGIPPHKRINIRGVDAMVVLVSSDTIKKCEETVEEYASNNKDRVNDKVRNNYFDQLLAYHCLRDPDDPTLNTKLASDVTEIAEILDNYDIGTIMEAYSELVMNKAPKIELLTEEQLDDIKKHLEVTKLSDLSTVSLVHLANFHLQIVSEQ